MLVNAGKGMFNKLFMCMSSPASRAVTLQVSPSFLTLGEVSLAAYNPQFVLVGRGQVDGSRGDCWAQVAWVWDVKVGVGVWPAKREENTPDNVFNC